MTQFTSFAVTNIFLSTILMLTAPLTVFFKSRTFFQESKGYDLQQSNLYSAIAAVVTVHLVMLVFIFFAWREKPEPQPPKFTKQD